MEVYVEVPDATPTPSPIAVVTEAPVYMSETDDFIDYGDIPALPPSFTNPTSSAAYLLGNEVGLVAPVACAILVTLLAAAGA